MGARSKEITLHDNLNPQEQIKETRNGKQEGKYNTLCNYMLALLPSVSLKDTKLYKICFIYLYYIKTYYIYNNNNPIKKEEGGTSLVIQWLGFRLPMQGVRVQSLARKLGSHMPHGQGTKAWNRGSIVTNSIKTLKKKKEEGVELYKSNILISNCN